MSVTPFFVDKGTASAPTTAATANAPNDESQPPRRLLILAIQTANQAVPSVTDRNGASTWTLVPGADVNNGGAAGVLGSVRGYLYYKWGSGNGDPLADGAIVGDSGDHTYVHIFSFDDVDRSDPFSAVVTSVQAATTAAVMPGVTTDQNNSLVCYWTFLTRDLGATANLSAQVNAGLTGVIEVHDQSTASGVGGGICLSTGVKATAGATGNMTATAVSQAMAHISVGLNPDISRAIVDQVEAEVWDIPSLAEATAAGVVEQLEAEVWHTIENAGRVYQMEAELWHTIQNAGRIYHLETEVWYSTGDGGRRMSFM